MNIEACEYRNAFLNYYPDIAVITNIDPDHLDFFKTEENYFAAFEKFIGQSKCVVILADEFLALEKREERIEQRGGFFDNCKTRIIVHPSYFEVV
jgi:UDP-N-acetylmuramate-alanine ligase